MPSYTVNILESPVHATTPLAIKSVLHTGSGSQDAKIDDITWEMNGHGRMTLTVPVNSTALDDLVEMGTEIEVYRETKRIFWGIPIKSNQSGSTVKVECRSLSYYLSRRYIGTARTNLISSGDMDATPPAIPTGWTENDTGDDINVATVTAGAAGAPEDITDSGELLEIRAKVSAGTDARIVDKNSDGKAVDSPVAIEDYHGPDDQVVQTWTNSTGSDQVYICKAWFYVRDDATYAYGGKPYDERGFYVQEQTSGGAWAKKHWWHPINDTTKRNEWVRAELAVYIRNGNKGQIRLYAPAHDNTLDSAIYWTSVGVYQEESLSFYAGDGDYVTSIIEGIVDHSNGVTVSGYASDKQDVLLDNDPANSSLVPPIKYQVAYQASDHRNAWDEIMNIANLRSTRSGSPLNGPIVGTTWSDDVSSAASRRIFSRSSTGTPKTGFDLVVGGSSNNIIDGAYTVNGEAIATRVVALGLGDGPDREESEHTDVSQGVPIEYETVINTGNTGINIKYLDDYARSSVAHRYQQQSLRVRIPATTAAGGWATDPIHSATFIRPGDKLNVGGTEFGRLPPLAETDWRIVKMTLTPDNEVLALELNLST